MFGNPHAVDIIFLWILVDFFVDIRRHVYNPHVVHIVFLWIVLKFDCDDYENEQIFVLICNRYFIEQVIEMRRELLLKRKKIPKKIVSPFSKILIFISDEIKNVAISFQKT